MGVKRFHTEIQTERLKLARLMPEDAPLVFYGWASKESVTRYLAWSTHQQMEETYTFLKAASSAWHSGQAFVFGIRLHTANRLIGSIGLHRGEDGFYEVGYALSPLFWNQGYAGEAVSGILNALLNTGIGELKAVVHPDNQASISVLRRAGFEEITGERMCVFPNLSSVPLRVRAFRWRSSGTAGAC